MCLQGKAQRPRGCQAPRAPQLCTDFRKSGPGRRVLGYREGCRAKINIKLLSSTWSQRQGSGGVGRQQAFAHPLTPPTFPRPCPADPRAPRACDQQSRIRRTYRLYARKPGQDSRSGTSGRSPATTSGAICGGGGRMQSSAPSAQRGEAVCTQTLHKPPCPTLLCVSAATHLKYALAGPGHGAC